MTASRSGTGPIGVTGPAVAQGGTAGHLPVGHALREFQIERVLFEDDQTGLMEAKPAGLGTAYARTVQGHAAQFLVNAFSVDSTWNSFSEGVALWVLLRGFGLELSTTLAVFFYATATLAGAIVPVPGGLGVAEAMIEEQLVRLGGVPHGPATAAMILVRFATLWWAVLVGFMALAILRGRHPHLLSNRPDLVPPAAVAPPER